MYGEIFSFKAQITKERPLHRFLQSYPKLVSASRNRPRPNPLPPASNCSSSRNHPPFSSSLRPDPKRNRRSCLNQPPTHSPTTAMTSRKKCPPSAGWGCETLAAKRPPALGRTRSVRPSTASATPRRCWKRSSTRCTTARLVAPQVARSGFVSWDSHPHTICTEDTKVTCLFVLLSL